MHVRWTRTDGAYVLAAADLKLKNIRQCQKAIMLSCWDYRWFIDYAKKHSQAKQRAEHARFDSARATAKKELEFAVAQLRVFIRAEDSVPLEYGAADLNSDAMLAECSFPWEEATTQGCAGERSVIFTVICRCVLSACGAAKHGCTDAQPFVSRIPALKAARSRRQFSRRWQPCGMSVCARRSNSAPLAERRKTCSRCIGAA